MSADKPALNPFAGVLLLWGLTGVSGLLIADDAEAPDLQFLEYLGSWDESDEDWMILVADAVETKGSEETEQEHVSAPDGEKMSELDNED
ncbi:MAG: hypothetical protein P8M18_00535 [Woeseiaceae bacterium]|nr:hypothetical protein [Woeseiaceae bacterium]